MKVCDFFKILDDVFPQEWAESWDNVGGLISFPQEEILGVAFCLEVNDFTIKKVLEGGANVVVTHHPFLFSPIKRIDFSSPFGRLLKEIVLNNISIYTVHTNWDTAPFGLNRVLCDFIEGDFVDYLKVLEDAEGKKRGIGVLCDLKREFSTKEFLRFLTQKLGIDWYRLIGKDAYFVKKVALCGGSGADLWDYAKTKGADVFITSDMKYHTACDIRDNDFFVIEVDHGRIEWISMKYLMKEIQSMVSELRCFLIEYAGSPFFKVGEGMYE